MGISAGFRAPFISVRAVDEHFRQPCIVGGVRERICNRHPRFRSHARSCACSTSAASILFGLLALYAGFIQPSLSLQAVRLVIDCGLLSIALVSMAIRNPFTLQYAREQTPQEFWDTPVFVRTNYIITMVWALSFLVTTAADATATFNKKFPLSLDIGIGLAALALAVVFTARYPVYVRAHVQRSVAEAARRTA
jgi:uncharacterized membrane protein HdeD (DUF308 family)